MANTDFLKNGAVWKDCDGETIHAHGGCILKYGKYFYWYGEDRRENYYISCYRSKNLIHWEFRNHILTMDSPMEQIRVKTQLVLQQEDHKKVNLERPKVLYNSKTGKFVLWVHYENGKITVRPPVPLLPVRSLTEITPITDILIPWDICQETAPFIRNRTERRISSPQPEIMRICTYIVCRMII